MSRTFRDTEALDAQIVLSTNYFGESCTYIPKGGEASTVTAIVDRSVRPNQDQFGLWSDRIAQATVLKAEIASIPEYGSSLKTSDLAEGEAYSFEGTIVDEDAAAWTLEFVIHDTKRRGGNWAKK